MKSIAVFVLAIASFMLSISVSAQSIGNYNTDEVRKAKITYDENFNPTVSLSLKNISAKTITTIEVVVYYSDPSNRYDIFKSYQETKIVQLTIKPGMTGNTTFKIPKGRDSTRPSGYLITKVRYQDGSICQ